MKYLTDYDSRELIAIIEGDVDFKEGAVVSFGELDDINKWRVENDAYLADSTIARVSNAKKWGYKRQLKKWGHKKIAKLVSTGQFIVSFKKNQITT